MYIQNGVRLCKNQLRATAKVRIKRRTLALFLGSTRLPHPQLRQPYQTKELNSQSKQSSETSLRV
ncbi:hypothetical protein DL89DRAFT_266103 [Linderina pennispora]|uniref:Uncharacterized protein n=1 Tax=Linderina pennispora TaxID=61395 RepID=A0A1Y1WBY9_9FUNG|nr:uncharacterized protein DL89DRAFT_266103 [Linderina pennispora]ORX71070.1 hypothetical protein DL89DRAFT_266103 [Linderina pennispora]